ncbi:hypothetical protein Glove_220g26 [Diversispora epigaea]|uniref:Protein kinase domain-containing protein n=1 Tax=Diversispora epigaea TaxID=1348612 RepID=A0A397ILI1_9GLOM|nr:hypothetical protein Glove_220g26 [Diversispora epigaea]
MNKTFKTRKLDGSNEFIICIKCNKRKAINSLHLCKRCNAMSSQIVDSGNKNIDDFIRETQFSKKSADNEFLKWVPYENLTKIEHIGKGGFSEIYKATWEKQSYINGTFETEKTEVVLKVLNDSRNVNTEFLKELKHTYQLRDIWDSSSIQCYGVTQIPKTKNYAFILYYAKAGDLHHFLNKNFEEMTWENKPYSLMNIVEGIQKMHSKKILHQDLHSGNILIQDNRGRAIISDLGFSQPANIDSNLSRESQLYGIIPYMAPELFKGQPYSYKSDIYSLGMIMDIWDSSSIQCYGVTQIPKTKNYAFILYYAKAGDLHHFLNKNFEEMTWENKPYSLMNIVEGIQKMHSKKILHQDLHSGNILIQDNRGRAIISDLGFSQPANIDSNLSRESQLYGIIPYMAPELFKGQPYSYKSDIYSLGMIMWQMTSGHRPFHDQEHGPKLILDILDGKRPAITEDTPENWANLMKRCWHPVPSQRPTINEIFKLSEKFSYVEYSEDNIKKYHPDKYDILLEFNKAEKKRIKMIEFKKPFVKNPGYYSRSLNSMLESINSTVSDLFSNDNLFSNDCFDINSNQINGLESSDGNSSAENSKKHFLDELLQEEIIEDQNDLKRRKISEYINECLAENVMD